MQSTYQMNQIQLFTTVLSSEEQLNISFFFIFINEGNVMISAYNTPVLIWIIVKYIPLLMLKAITVYNDI